MKYTVLTASSPDELAEKVEKAHGEGWMLQGGVSVAAWHVAVVEERKGYTDHQQLELYAQAMTRDGS
jgi:hypothetical protein